MNIPNIVLNKGEGEGVGKGIEEKIDNSNKTKKDTTSQDTARQDKTGHENTRQDKTAYVIMIMRILRKGPGS